MSLQVAPRWRLILAYVGLGALALVIIGRLYVLQVQQRDSLLGWGKQISVRTETIPAFRGDILDRNGRVLAMSTPGMLAFG